MGLLWNLFFSGFSFPGVGTTSYDYGETSSTTHPASNAATNSKATAASPYDNGSTPNGHRDVETPHQPPSKGTVTVSNVPTTAHICTCPGYLQQLETLENCFKQLQQNTTADNFYRNIGMVASLGSSISFALIVTDIADPREISKHGRFDLPTVRILLAISWLLFMVALNFSFSFAQNATTFGARGRLVASKVVYFLDIVAVLMLSLVVAAYVEVVGYTGIALTSYVAVLVVLEPFVTKRAKRS